MDGDDSESSSSDVSESISIERHVQLKPKSKARRKLTKDLEQAENERQNLEVDLKDLKERTVSHHIRKRDVNRLVHANDNFQRRAQTTSLKVKEIAIKKKYLRATNMQNKKEEERNLYDAVHHRIDVVVKDNVQLETIKFESEDKHKILQERINEMATGTDENMYCEKSLSCIPKTNPARAIAIKITDSWLDYLVLPVVILNVVFLCLEDPLFTTKDDLSVLLSTMNILTTILFLAEMLVRILATGFLLHPLAYMRNGWNVMDFIINVLSVIGLLPDVASLSSFRTLRVFRAMRAVTKFKGLQLMVSALIISLTQLGNLGILVFFLFFLFSIFGIQLWEGDFHQRCYINGTIVDGILIPIPNTINATWPTEINQTWPIFTQDSYLAYAPTSWISDRLNLTWPPTELEFTTIGNDFFSVNEAFNITKYLDPRNVRLCSIDSNICPDGSSCISAAPLPRDVLGYDHLGTSLLTLFVAMTADGWSLIMNMNQDSFSPYVWIFYIAFMVVCNMFTINLTLAVVSTKFNQVSAQRSYVQKRRRQADKFVMDDTSATSSSTDPIVDNPAQDARWNILLRKIVSDVKFDWAVSGVILLNLIILSLAHYNQPKVLDYVFEYSNYVFTIIFLLEMIVKMAAFGIIGYFTSNLNKFDFILVVANIVEILINLTLGVTNNVVLILRSFRLIRVLKLFKKWRGINLVIRTILRSISSVIYLLLLFLVFVLIFALAGRQLLAGKMIFNGEIRPYNYDSLWWSLVTTFHVMTGDGWSDVMFDAMNVNVGFFIFYFLQIFIGMFILTSLLIGVLLAKYSKVKQEFERKKRRKRRASGAKYSEDEEEDENDEDDTSDVYSSSNESSSEVSGESHDTSWKSRSLFIFSQDNFIRKICVIISKSIYFEIFVIVVIVANCIVIALDNPSQPPLQFQILQILDNIFSAIFIVEMIIRVIASGFVLGKKSYLRQPWNRLDFIVVIITIIGMIPVAGSIGVLKALRALRVLRVLRLVPRFQRLQVAVNAIIKVVPMLGNISVIVILFFFIFALVGVNLWAGKFYYCTDPTITTKEECIGEFNSTVLSIRYLSIFTQRTSVSLSLPYYASAHSPSFFYLDGSASAFDSITSYYPPYSPSDSDLWNSGNISIISQNLTIVPEPVLIIPDNSSNSSLSPYISSVQIPRQWINRDYNFDNVGAALLTLFHVATLSGWPSVMYTAVSGGFSVANVVGNSSVFFSSGFRINNNNNNNNTSYNNNNYCYDTDDNNACYYDNDYFGVCTNNCTVLVRQMEMSNPEYAMYFIGFVLIMSYWLFKLFSVVIIDTFASSTSKSSFVTKRQAEDIFAQRIWQASRIKIPRKLTTNKPRKILLTILTSKWLDYFIMICVLFNSLILAISFQGMSEEFSSALEIVNYVFLGIFTLEAILKIITLGPIEYFGPRGSFLRLTWNKFDFSLVIAGLLGVALRIGPFVNSLRMFRVARSFRLVKKWKGLNIMFQTFVRSLPSIANVSALLLLFYYIYAAIGVKLLGGIKYQSRAGINQWTNFDNFPNALLTLFRISTRDMWYPIMYECMGSPLCKATSQPGETCGETWYFVYFVSFVYVQSLVTLNLFLAILTENFTSYRTGEDAILRKMKSISNKYDVRLLKNFEQFKEAWICFDPETTFYLSLNTFLQLMQQIPPPIGFKDMTKSTIIDEFYGMGIRLTDDLRVCYLEVICGLGSRAAEIIMKPEYIPIDQSILSELTNLTVSQYLAQQLRSYVKINKKLREIQQKLQNTQQNQQQLIIQQQELVNQRNELARDDPVFFSFDEHDYRDGEDSINYGSESDFYTDHKIIRKAISAGNSRNTTNSESDFNTELHIIQRATSANNSLFHVPTNSSEYYLSKKSSSDKSSEKVLDKNSEKTSEKASDLRDEIENSRNASKDSKKKNQSVVTVIPNSVHIENDDYENDEDTDENSREEEDVSSQSEQTIQIPEIQQTPRQFQPQSQTPRQKQTEQIPPKIPPQSQQQMQQSPRQQNQPQSQTPRQKQTEQFPPKTPPQSLQKLHPSQQQQQQNQKTPQHSPTKIPPQSLLQQTPQPPLQQTPRHSQNVQPQQTHTPKTQPQTPLQNVHQPQLPPKITPQLNLPPKIPPQSPLQQTPQLPLQQQETPRQQSQYPSTPLKLSTDGIPEIKFPTVTPQVRTPRHDIRTFFSPNLISTLPFGRINSSDDKNNSEGTAPSPVAKNLKSAENNSTE